MPTTTIVTENAHPSTEMEQQPSTKPQADSKTTGPATAVLVNGTTPNVKPTKFRSKYKHVEAPHKVCRPSVLSHDSTEVPSFLGFRNLMVLTISECPLHASEPPR